MVTLPPLTRRTWGGMKGDDQDRVEVGAVLFLLRGRQGEELNWSWLRYMMGEAGFHLMYREEGLGMSYLNKMLIEKEIVLFKSLRNNKRSNKGNFTSKSNSNKIKLCGGGGQHYLVLNKLSTLKFRFLGLFAISK